MKTLKLLFQIALHINAIIWNHCKIAAMDIEYAIKSRNISM